MVFNQQLSFLQEKIQDIGSALFFNLSDSVLRFPTTLVTTLKVDEYGYVWFFVKKPRQEVKEFEGGFPVRLDFYRKGFDYFLQVSGKAWAVHDPEEMNFLQPVLGTVPHPEQWVLIKVKMLQAEYHDTQATGRHTWWQSAVNAVSTWFRSSNGPCRSSTYTYNLSAS